MGEFDARLKVMKKIAQWLGSETDAENIMDPVETGSKCVVVTNATARMQIPVHPHGFWHDGNVGYDPDRDIIFTQTLVKTYSNVATGGVPTSIQNYTVTAGKAL